MDKDERDRLTKLETLHESRHEENKSYMKRIDGTTSKIWDKLDNLQCQTHSEKMYQINKRISGQSKYIFFFITAIVGLAIFIIKGLLT